MEAPVPNFRALTLKAGEVPKFFDTVLANRASDAVAQVGVRCQQCRALTQPASMLRHL